MLHYAPTLLDHLPFLAPVAFLVAGGIADAHRKRTVSRPVRTFECEAGHPQR